MHFIGKSFPDGTTYIANPQKYYGNIAANSQKGYSKGNILMFDLKIILAFKLIIIFNKWNL